MTDLAGDQLACAHSGERLVPRGALRPDTAHPDLRTWDPWSSWTPLLCGHLPHEPFNPIMGITTAHDGGCW